MSFELQEIGRLTDRVNLMEEVLDKVSDGGYSKSKAEASQKKAAAEAAKKPITLTAEEHEMILKAREAASIQLTDEEKAAILAKRAGAATPAET